MNRGTCVIPDCGKPIKGREWCAKHYDRWRTKGDPLAARRYTRDPVERFERDVNRSDPNGCWTWHGGFDPSGYARMSAGGAHRTLKVATWAYEHYVGLIPNGHHLDHVCHTSDTSCSGGRACVHRGCVNPRHLEPVWPSENALRGRGFVAHNAGKTHCALGHPYDEENTYWRPRGGRDCRTCRRTNVAKAKAKAKAKA